MAGFKTLQGILALVDIVNFTGQANKLGEKFTAQYTAYFQKKIKGIVGKHDFQVIKFQGDAALIFGTDPGNLLEIMLDLFERDKPEDKFGFISRFRMVAHTSYFHFQMEGNQPIDLVSAEGIKVFRLEKYAAPWELMVTQELYPGVKSLLTEKNIEVKRIEINQPPKGFDKKEWFPTFYKLTITEKEVGASILLEQRMAALARDVEYIPVFGNMYPPVPMDKNFINLSILCDREQDAIRECEELYGDKRKRKEDDWIFHERLERRPRADFIEIDVDTLYKNKNKRYTGGVIFGLPGAGKTTILRHLAHKELTANKRRKPHRKKVVLFVSCRDIPFYDHWHKDQYGTETVVGEVNTALEYMTWVFLFGSRGSGDLKPEELVEFRNAVKKVKQAFKENRLTLLVDALDEAPDSLAKERIKELVLLLASQNRLFLTARPSERVHLRQGKLPVFNVLSLTMDQVRNVARHLMDPDSYIYKKFDEAIWKEEIVVKMAATPINALLVTAYFQAYGQFDPRFPMYDLLLKFILLKVWENIKTETFPYKYLELFFEEVKKIDFFEKYEDARVIYDGLGSLCFRLFFEGSGGKVHRMVNDETLKRHFELVIAQRFNYDENRLAAFVQEWIERFQKDHLLLQAGAGEYVFIHSTIMEYLAAFYMIQQAGKDVEKIPALVRAALDKEDYLRLESVPIAAGSDLLKGFTILSALRDIKVEYARELLYELGIKCLAEVEWQITKIFEAIRIESLKKPVLDLIHENRGAFTWLYEYLREVVSINDKSQLRENIERLDTFIKLSRRTFLEEYLDYEAFDKADSELVGLRKQLLLKLVQEELVRQWLDENKAAAEKAEAVVDNVLQLDSPGYHPEDKNFNYFRDMIGNELVGFFGSPNLRHKACQMAQFSPDGKVIASASAFGTLIVWDASSGKEICTFKGHNGYIITKYAFSMDGKSIISFSNDKNLKFWEIATGKVNRSIIYKIDVLSFFFSSNGKLLIAGFANNAIKVCDFDTHEELQSITCHTRRLEVVAFSPDGKKIISSSDNNTLDLWEVLSGKKIHTFYGHKGRVSDCAFSTDGKLIVSASDDKTLKLWEVLSGKEIRTLSGHKGKVRDCAFSPDGKKIISASDDNTLKLWYADSGVEINSYIGFNNRIYGFAFSIDGKHIVSNFESNLNVLNVSTGKKIRTFIGHKHKVYSCRFSHDGQEIVTASDIDNTSLKLWDANSGKELLTFKTAHINAFFDCSFSPDGNIIASASDRYGTLMLWEKVSGKKIRDIKAHFNFVHCCAFSTDGKFIASGGDDHKIKLWNVDDGKKIRTLTGHNSDIRRCIFSRDGKTLVSASWDNTLKLWDVDTGKEIRSFRGHQSAVRDCGFSPDGNTLVSASNDHTLKLWDVSTGKEIRTFSGHKNEVLGCGFSPDGNTLISVSEDHTLKLWDVDSGKEIHSVKLPWIPYYVSVSPINPHRIITANENGTVTMFEFEALIKK